MQRSSQRGASALGVCLLLLVLAALDVVALGQLGAPGAAEGFAAARAAAAAGDLAGAWSAAAAGYLLPWLLLPILGPLAIAIAALFLGGSRATAAPAAQVAAAPPREEASRTPAPSPPSAAGLRLLATLQEEARLLDFVREDIDAYSDEQVGAAVRGIHAALRKAIDGRLTLEPILAGDDGDRVEVPAGFEPALIRVVGRPPAKAPFHGVLRHGGWRASSVSLPSPTPGSDPAILMPAEVEVE